MLSLNEEQMNQSEIDWLVANKDQVDFNGTLRSLIWEQKFAHLLGAKFVDKPGYDLIHPTLKRVAVKCSFSWHLNPRKTSATTFYSIVVYLIK